MVAFPSASVTTVCGDAAPAPATSAGKLNVTSTPAPTGLPNPSLIVAVAVWLAVPSAVTTPVVAVSADCEASAVEAVNSTDLVPAAPPPTGSPPIAADTSWLPLTVDVISKTTVPSAPEVPVAAPPPTIVTSAGSVSATSAPSTGFPELSFAVTVTV